jgi:hypothetical protein
MYKSPKKPSCCLGFKHQGTKLAKTRNLGLHRNDFAYVGGKSRKSAKNQGEIQGRRTPSVFFVVIMRQKRNEHTPSRGKESLQKISNLFG